MVVGVRRGGGGATGRYSRKKSQKAAQILQKQVSTLLRNAQAFPVRARPCTGMMASQSIISYFVHVNATRQNAVQAGWASLLVKQLKELSRFAR